MISRVHLFVVSVLLFFSTSSLAASISAVKGPKVLINLEGDETTEGDEFFLINPETGKKTAIIRIKQVKGSKALGEIVKGKAAAGFTLQAKAPTAVSAEAEPSAAQQSSRGLKDSYGILGGYLMNTMNADVSYQDSLGANRTAATSMSGTGFAVGGYYNYALTPSLAISGSAFIEQFNVAGTASAAACSSSTSCDAKINYLSLYGLGKWYFLQGQYSFWAGGGGGFLLALSKSSTALNESQISTNQVFTAAAGCDVQMSSQNSIPISLEYSMFPASDTVKASMIVIRAGWAWNL